MEISNKKIRDILMVIILKFNKIIIKYGDYSR
jgi:hypothetical protein